MCKLLFFGIIILFIGIRIFIKWKKPIWKGMLSEQLVYKNLLQLPDEYIVFSNLMFESNNHSTQIDQVVVSPYGVFVIETKGYKGWILGGESSTMWQQVLYKEKNYFYNPIKQNEGHVRFLQHLLRCGIVIPFIPIVVFDNNATLKMKITNHTVIKRRNLKKEILKYIEPKLSQNSINWIVDIINQNMIETDNEVKKRHIENIKGIENLIDQGICPRCKGKLVLRNSKYGEFYGCSNYPKCKYILK